MTDSTKERYTQATNKTTTSLKHLATTQRFQELSQLTLPEIQQVVDLVAEHVPAGNIPGMILNGLARLSKKQRAPLGRVRRDINLLFRGAEHNVDRAIYTTFFAGPAAVLWGYQNILKLVGKNPEDAFPEGTWQFYVEYAMREDTARHATETHGFDTTLKASGVNLKPVDRITAWMMASVQILHQYDALLKNEWRERVHLRILGELDANYAGLYRQWEKERPYHSPDETPYAVYRRAQFDAFIANHTAKLPDATRKKWNSRLTLEEKMGLVAYERQMSIHAFLHPERYNEIRSAIPLQNLRVGLIYQGHYYLLPICEPNSQNPVTVATIRAQVASILDHPVNKVPAAMIDSLATVQRREHQKLYNKDLSEELRQEIGYLRLAPIIFNADQRPADKPLSQIRKAKRGIGDHALTLFDTGKTFVFDLSHIFFDGTWGAALAELMTQEAIRYGKELAVLPKAEPAERRPYSPKLQLTDLEKVHIANLPKTTPEASAETEVIQINKILSLRKLFSARNDQIKLTVNDILVLFRAIHAVGYDANPFVVDELNKIASEERTKPAADQALAALNKLDEAPATLIPIDGSRHAPKDRLYPMNFQVPLDELDLIGLHNRTIQAAERYQQAEARKDALYKEFHTLRSTYLATLAGFGTVVSHAKAIAIRKQDTSSMTIQLLAHMPKAVQNVLNTIPDSFDLLNDLLKGREVFSNVGAVAKESTLTRFITAKDDNEKKTLAWGIITDAQGAMRVSLRDFRPHVGALHAIGRPDVADFITQDYLDTYAHQLNKFVRELHLITELSKPKKTRSSKSK